MHHTFIDITSINVELLSTTIDVELLDNTTIDVELVDLIIDVEILE